MENDKYFNVYSIVDERSAGFFALGLSETLNEPVCVSCTSATATCNYMPAVKEAYERNIQLILLTADRNKYVKFNMDDQNIDQNNMYDGYVKYQVDLPNINNKNDAWFFNRKVNEALLNMDFNGKGPVQINFEMNYSLEELSYFPCQSIPKARKIEKMNKDINWEQIAQNLINKKVMIICGSNYYNNTILRDTILKFSKKINCVILGDYFSNMIDDDIINPSYISNFYENSNYKKLKPDIIILLGNVLYFPLKYNKNIFSYDVETWQISKDLRLNDGFRNVKKIFEMDENEFFSCLNEKIDKTNKQRELYIEWKKTIDKVKLPSLGFTHMGVIKELIDNIPKDALIHTSVLDAIRITNYYHVPANVKVFGNIGADGIDGALSTFLGQASENDTLSYLIIGDLSFMYDMNALYDKIPSNVRILVINNYAGSEFYRNFGVERIPTLRDFIAAGHTTLMKDVVSISNINYTCATNYDELKLQLKDFVKKSEKPMIIEAITDADRDAKKLTEFWNINKPNFEAPKNKVKKILKRILKFLHVKKK